MKLKEFLKYNATLPYNSAVRELPESYAENIKYGLDCFGFVELMQSYFPDTQPILGSYGQGFAHQAAVLDEKYVDPFLRMSDSAVISASPSRISTYYAGSDVSVNIDGNNRLTVNLTRTGKTLNTYNFDLNNRRPDTLVTDPRIYKYVFLHDGQPISVVKTKTGIEVVGMPSQSCDEILRNRFRLSLADIKQMFFDASQFSQYSKFQSRW
jgi:hypothetical protein